MELCSIIVVTTLSPSRNSVSIEYMTALMASVVFRYSAMLARPGALMNCAISSNERSKSAVVASEALDCPRWTFSYRGASEAYSASSSRGGWVLAALFVTIRPSAGNAKCLRMAWTSTGSEFMAIAYSRGPDSLMWLGRWPQAVTMTIST